MKEALLAIEELRESGIVGGYAIGGAVGATYYLEPVATLDVDVFVAFEGAGAGELVSLSPIYRHLEGKGFELRGEYVVMGGWPVKFLSVGDALGEEAIAEAVEVEVEGVRTRVMSAEHLVALALQAGRGKDLARVVQFVEAGVLDMGRLQSILERHGLTAAWDRFARRFLTEDGA